MEMIDDALGQVTRRGRALDQGAGIQPGRVQVAREQRLEHLFLAGEMRVQAALGQAGARGDVVHPGPGIAGGRKLLQRGVKDLPDAHGWRETLAWRAHHPGSCASWRDVMAGQHTH